jgi:TonB family protein
VWHGWRKHWIATCKYRVAYNRRGMTLWEFLRQWQGGRLAAGVIVSVLLHLAIIAVVLGVRLPSTNRWDVKRGEPLIVELPPKADDSPPPGPPGAPAPARPTRSARGTASPPATPPSAKNPSAVAAAEPPRRAQAARQSQPQHSRVASAESAPRPPASVPEPAAPAVATPAPSAPPAAPAPTSAAAAPAPAQPAERPSTDHAAAEHPAADTPARPSSERQVASLPPAGRSTPDTLKALRRGGGAGGHGEGHAGIEGEPIPLDSTDPRYSDYLEQVRRRIKEKWGYPCEKNEQTRVCEYRSTQLLIAFGIQKNGELAFVTLLRTSGHPIYDDYAVNAVKLASPFPPIPDSFSKSGVPIHASFHYVLQSSLTNIFR